VTFYTVGDGFGDQLVTRLEPWEPWKARTINHTSPAAGFVIPGLGGINALSKGFDIDTLPG
jgi:hypothetical protein